MRVLTKIALLVLLGSISSLAIGEIALRLTEDVLPTRSPWPSTEIELKHRQLESNDSYEVVFLGSSVTEAAIDPRRIDGVSAYNAALPFSTPISNEVWYEGEFGDSKTVRTVVLGLLAWPYHVETRSDPLVAALASASSHEPGLFESSALWRHRGLISDWLHLTARERALNSGFWTDNGHQTAYYEKSPETPNPRNQIYGDPHMGMDVESAIRRIAARLQDSGGQFVLMVEPARFPGAVRPELIDQYLQSLSDLAASLNVELWDTYSVGWDPALYADDAHFNEIGTVLYTAYVAELLDGLDQDL